MVPPGVSGCLQVSLGVSGGLLGSRSLGGFLAPFSIICAHVAQLTLWALEQNGLCLFSFAGFLFPFFPLRLYYRAAPRCSLCVDGGYKGGRQRRTSPACIPLWKRLSVGAPDWGLERRLVSKLAHPSSVCMRETEPDSDGSDPPPVISCLSHQHHHSTDPEPHIHPHARPPRCDTWPGMEGEMQPADEGPCAPKMCRQQRGPYSSLKPFQSKRSAGKSRFDRSAVVELPLFGDGHHFTFHPEQPHHFQPHHQHHQHQHHHQQQQQRLQQLHQTSVATSSSQQHHQTPQQQQQQQQQQHRLPCENRPSSRVPTSTSAPAASLAVAAAAASPGAQQRRGSRFSPDCTYSISSGGSQTCSEWVMTPHTRQRVPVLVGYFRFTPTDSINLYALSEEVKMSFVCSSCFFCSHLFLCFSPVSSDWSAAVMRAVMIESPVCMC